MYRRRGEERPKVLGVKGLSHTGWLTDQAWRHQVQLRSPGRRHVLSDAEEDALPCQALQETLVPAGSIWHDGRSSADLPRTGISEQTGCALLGVPVQADGGRWLGDPLKTLEENGRAHEPCTCCG